MVALPDGTMFIMNGAHQGYGGFGLAGDPNLNAVLFDPTQPQGQRFSILNNTIVARMYHSEATLLPDASILVSGSDPLDPRYPEEYRIEVKFPTYFFWFVAKAPSAALCAPLPRARPGSASIHRPEQRLVLQRSISDNQCEAFPGNNSYHSRFTHSRSV